VAADHILAIDQGTTSSRAILFDRSGRAIATAQREIAQHYPHPGWVEHDPEEIWFTTLQCAQDVAERIGPERIAAIGITNQRETSLLWDRATGEPLHRAIVWQDRRTAERCAQLRAEGLEELVRATTGLLLDPYFSATKLAWLLDHVPGARARAERGELAFGTVDSFLLWRLTGGAVHATDLTNASRTALLDLRTGAWDAELCRLFDVPAALLPQVRGNAELLGVTSAGLFGRPLPITGMAGDQQAALFGQCCFTPGTAKSTYGTGCFLLLNTGLEPAASTHRLLTTPAWSIGGETTYALEGSIFTAGAAVKWLRDGLGVIADAAETERLATRLAAAQGIYLVPAFAGLGAPHWDPDARGALFGLTLGTSPQELAAATLEAIAFQTRDLAAAMALDCGHPLGELRIDGGMAANGRFCQLLADLVGVPVDRPQVLETTALGAAFLAGLGAGLWNGLDDLARTRRNRDGFTPALSDEDRAPLLAGWQRAVVRTLSA
jgi:glycerol kinase